MPKQSANNLGQTTIYRGRAMNGGEIYFQVIPHCRTSALLAIHPACAGFPLAPASRSGDFAVSLAPFVRRDVHGAELQVG